MALAQRARVAAPPAVRLTPVFERTATVLHLPPLDPRGGGTGIRSMSSRLEHLCCLRHLRLLIEQLDARSLLDVGCGDAHLFQKLPPNGDVREQFELVTAVDVLQHIPDDGVSSFLRSIDARVAPGGHAIITVPSVVVPLDAKHFRHYDERGLRNQVKESGAKLHIVSVEHVFKHRGLAHRWLELLENRFWTIDAKPLRRFTWNLVWNHLRMGNARNARHVVAVLRKT
jgi:hypothetical protein